MRNTPLLYLLASLCAMLALGSAAQAATGPQTAWNVFTLPNPVVTPNWRTYAPPDCASDPDSCANDNRFWEEWDFTNFTSAIDSSFAALAQQGQYQGAMVLLPLGDTPYFWSNIQLIYNSAAKYGVVFELALFPKWKYGAEYCYLYNTGAPSACPTVSGTTTAIAYRQLLKMMTYTENLGSNCVNNASNRPFAIWYGWSDYSPGFGALKSFWLSLPTSTCNLRSSYLTWLDSGFAGNTDVQRMQNYVTKRLSQPYWVNTELYSTSQIQQYDNTYAPYQTIITGFWGASDITSWAQGMCSQWNTAQQPVRLGVWTFYDRDVSPIEYYRSYINSQMAVAGSICSY